MFKCPECLALNDMTTIALISEKFTFGTDKTTGGEYHRLKVFVYAKLKKPART
jgi:hypothetical protein